MSPVERYAYEMWRMPDNYVKPKKKVKENKKEVTCQYRTKANYGDYGWSRWINCSKEFYEHREKTPLRNGFCYEVRKAHGIGVDDE